MDNNCHIPDLVQAYSYVENGELNLVLKLAQPLTSMTVASNSSKKQIYSASILRTLFVLVISQRKYFSDLILLMD